MGQGNGVGHGDVEGQGNVVDHEDVVEMCRLWRCLAYGDMLAQGDVKMLWLKKMMWWLILGDVVFLFLEMLWLIAGLGTAFFSVRYVPFFSIL